MRTVFFYLLFTIGLTIFGFGVYATYQDLEENLKYTKIQKDNPDKLIISPYGTTVTDYDKAMWKSFLIWSIITLIGWTTIYYSDKSLHNKKWINDEFAPLIVIAIFAIPFYYYFSTIN